MNPFASLFLHPSAWVALAAVLLACVLLILVLAWLYGEDSP